MSLKDADRIDHLDIVNDVLIFIAVAVVPFFFFGTLLPTWLFFNTIQLIAYTPLVSAEMPPNALYFLQKYLKLMRFFEFGVFETTERRMENLPEFFNTLIL